MSDGCGPKPSESFAKLDLDGCWRKTYQGYFQPTLEGYLESFSETWPKMGSMSHGECYRLPSLEHPISESASGLWPTPQAHDAKKGDPSRVGRFGTKHGGRNLNDEVMLWPTPRATDGSHGGRVTPRKGREGGNLIEAVSASMFPTPTANRWDGLQSHGVNVVSGQLNPEWVELLMGFPRGWSALEEG